MRAKISSSVSPALSVDLGLSAGGVPPRRLLRNLGYFSEGARPFLRSACVPLLSWWRAPLAFPGKKGLRSVLSFLRSTPRLYTTMRRCLLLEAPLGFLSEPSGGALVASWSILSRAIPTRRRTRHAAVVRRPRGGRPRDHRGPRGPASAGCRAGGAGSASGNCPRGRPPQIESDRIVLEPSGRISKFEPRGSRFEAFWPSGALLAART